MSVSPSPSSSPKVVAFFAALDARLAELSDDGDKATYLQINLDRTDREQMKLSAGVGNSSASAFDLSEVSDGINNRLERLRAEIRAKIAGHERRIAPMFTVIQGGRA